MANTSHGLIKIAGRDIDSQDALTEPQRAGRRTARAARRLQGAVNLAANSTTSHVLVLQTDDDGRHHLHSLKTASL